jgi:hypothetical protein
MISVTKATTVTVPTRISPFIFRWEIEEGGYEWKRQRKNTDARLVGRGGLESRIMLYEPMEAFPGLFLEFAKLKPTRDSIRQFADRYGNLFDTYDIADTVVQNERMVGGSTFQEWKREIEYMDAIVNLWEAVKDHNMTELRKIIKWTDNGVLYSVKTRGGALSSSVLTHKLNSTFKEMLARFGKPGSVLQPARYALRREINKRVAFATTVPRLMWASGARLDGQPPKPDAHLRIAFVPSNLIAAMWLQFAQAVTGECQLRRCDECEKHFPVGPGGKRLDADTCSVRCRQRKKRRLDGKARIKSLR